MTTSLFKTVALVFFGALGALLWCGAAEAATNISAVTTEHWAWNDSVGWIDLYNTDTVTVSSQKIAGYASSSAGTIAFDCDNAALGLTCGGPAGDWKVKNDGLGNLSGWAWNDAYGWISFCGGLGTSDCPGSINYRVLVTASGTRSVFSQWAWNDVVGWISVNCADLAQGCSPSDYKVVTSWIATSTSGMLESSIFDTGVTSGAQLNSVLWRGNQPAGTSVNFQFAASNASSGPWNYAGPDGTSGSYYTPSVDQSMKLDYTFYNNRRYFRYKVTLTSNQAQTASPRVDDVIINWSP